MTLTTDPRYSSNSFREILDLFQLLEENEKRKWYFQKCPSLGAFALGLRRDSSMKPPIAALNGESKDLGLYHWSSREKWHICIGYISTVEFERTAMFEAK